MTAIGQRRSAEAASTGSSSDPRGDAAAVATGRREPGRLRGLDGLRLAAALMVAMYHYLARDNTAWGQRPETVFPHADALAPYGWLGVEIFFVISGFVICMSCWGRSLRDFFTSRVIRLYPAYWCGVLLTAAVTTVVPVMVHGPSATKLLTNLTMLQEPFGQGHVDWVYWTLWVELRFYLLMALLLVWRGLSYRSVAGFCMVWTVVSAVASQSGSELLNTVAMPQYAPLFICGVAAYLLHRFGSNLLTWGILGVNAALSCNSAVHTAAKYSGNAVAQQLRPAVVIAIVLVGLLLVLGIALGHLSWLRWRWLTVAGSLTYPFYLVHEFIGWSVIEVLHGHFGLSPYVVLPVTVVAMLGLAWLIHRFVERPLAPLLKRALQRVPLGPVSAAQAGAGHDRQEVAGDRQQGRR